MRSLTLILLFAIFAEATAFPERFTAAYTLVSKGAAVGEAKWSLVPAEDGRFVYEVVTSTVGILSLVRNDRRIERSEWRYHDDRIRPLKYRYNRTGRKARIVEVDFDWDHEVARNTARGQTWRMPLPAETLDKNVYLLALMRDLGAGKREVAYTIADGGKVKTYRLAVIGSEQLHTKVGPVDTLQVRRIREASKRETTFWCAAELSFLPVKVVHREKDGSTVTLLLDSLDGFSMLPGRPLADR